MRGARASRCRNSARISQRWRQGGDRESDGTGRCLETLLLLALSVGGAEGGSLELLEIVNATIFVPGGRDVALGVDAEVGSNHVSSSADGSDGVGERAFYVEDDSTSGERRDRYRRCSRISCTAGRGARTGLRMLLLLLLPPSEHAELTFLFYGGRSSKH